METATGIRKVAAEPNSHHISLRLDDFRVRAAAVSVAVPAMDPLGYLDVVEPARGVLLEIEVDN